MIAMTKTRFKAKLKDFFKRNVEDKLDELTLRLEVKDLIRKLLDYSPDAPYMSKLFCTWTHNADGRELTFKERFMRIGPYYVGLGATFENQLYPYVYAAPDPHSPETDAVEIFNGNWVCDGVWKTELVPFLREQVRLYEEGIVPTKADIDRKDSELKRKLANEAVYKFHNMSK